MTNGTFSLLDALHHGYFSDLSIRSGDGEQVIKVIILCGFLYIPNKLILHVRMYICTLHVCTYMCECDIFDTVEN